jgi:hypothetical protein
MTEYESDVVKVALIADETAATKQKSKDKPFIFNSIVLSSSPSLLLPHAPKRCRAVLSISTTGVLYFGDSQSAVQTAITGEVDTACAQLTGPIPYMELTGTTEVWCILASGGPSIAGVIQEFYE